MKYVRSARNVREVRRALRGKILDRRGNVLATTTQVVDLGVDPYSTNERDYEKFISLASLLNISDDVLKKSWQKESFMRDGKVHKTRWKKIAEINRDEYEKVMALKIKGVYGVSKELRRYPNNTLASHVIGFVNKEGTPVSGVEAHMDHFLRGQDGWIESQCDGRRHELPLLREIDVAPHNGANVELTIDINIHSAVEKLLEDTVNRYHAHSGCVIVSDPYTGELLAMCNFPTFSCAAYNKSDAQNLRNRAITDTYEPGSVFKIVPFSVALQQGEITLDQVFDCSLSEFCWQGKRYELPNDHASLGTLTAPDVLRKSSNRGSAQIGIRLGKNRLYNAAKVFGFGTKSGYGFDGEVSGILHAPEKWDGLTITRLPMGHALSATPLQVHMAMGVIASGGYLLAPKIIRRVADDNGQAVFQSETHVREHILTTDTAFKLREILYHPDAHPASIDGVKLAYKTGTTQKLINGKYSREHHISSCSGFFPMENPQYLATVVIDDAHLDSGTAYGSKIAYPLFCDIARFLLHYGMLSK